MKKRRVLLYVLVFLNLVQMPCNALTLTVINKDSQSKEFALAISYMAFNQIHEHIDQSTCDQWFSGLRSELEEGKASLAIVKNENYHCLNIFFKYDNQNNLIQLCLLGYASQNLAKFCLFENVHHSKNETIKLALGMVIEHIKNLPIRGNGIYCKMLKGMTDSYRWLIDDLDFVQDDSLFCETDGYSRDKLTWHVLWW